MFRKLTKADRDRFLEMSRAFFASPAVCESIPMDYHDQTFDQLMAGTPYAAAWVICKDENQLDVIGYVLTAKTWSREAGGMVEWLEEFYIEPAYRSQGYASAFFKFWEQHLLDQHNCRRIRLEIHPNNLRAAALYQQLGFKPMGYQSWIKAYPPSDGEAR